MTKEELTLRVILRKLDTLYTPPKTFLDYRTPLDLLVATILSAQCTDARVNIVTKTLFATCKTPEDYANLPRKELEELIHSCGTYKNKSKFIQEMCKILIDDYDGNVPQTMADLTRLSGVGKKTASIILSALFGKNEYIAVDTHVMRLSRRLGLTKQLNPDKIALELMEHVPRKRWADVNTLLISHGRSVCTAINRKCDACVFKDTCPSSKVKECKDLNKEGK